MASQSDLLTKLKLKAQISADERLDDTLLNTVLDQSLAQHNPAYTYATLPPAEEMLVILLAQIEVCYIRAEKFSAIGQQSGGGGAGGIIQVDSPFNKCLKLAQQLAVRYKEICEMLGIYSGAQVVVAQSTAYIRSDRLDRVFPYAGMELPPVPVLSASVKSATEVQLSWAVQREVDFFERWIIWLSFTPGIYQSWNAVGNMNVPRIASSAQLLFQTTDQDARSIWVQALTQTTYYFIIVTKTLQNKFTYSAEINATPA